MEVLPEELVVNVCQNMDITELKNFIRTSKTHYRICDEILEDKFEEAIDKIIQASKRPSVAWLQLEPASIDRSFLFKLASHGFTVREDANVARQFNLNKLGWSKERQINHTKINGNEKTMRLILLDLLTNDYINGNFYFVQ